jgi:putative transcriptional regulator
MMSRLLAHVGFFAGLWCASLPLVAADELAAGQILVADRKLRDPHFDGTVVVLITYDEEGAVGLILNRKTETPVTKILGRVKEAQGRKDLAFEGGPVETQSILALTRSREKLSGSQHLFGDVYAILTEGPLKETLATGVGSNLLRFYMGYAGWGPGQLDAEVDAGAWHILKGDANAVFDPNPDSLWERLIRQSSLSVARTIDLNGARRQATQPDGLPH